MACDRILGRRCTVPRADIGVPFQGEEVSRSTGSHPRPRTGPPFGECTRPLMCECVPLVSRLAGRDTLRVPNPLPSRRRSHAPGPGSSSTLGRCHALSVETGDRISSVLWVLPFGMFSPHEVGFQRATWCVSHFDSRLASLLFQRFGGSGKLVG